MIKASIPNLQLAAVSARFASGEKVIDLARASVTHDGRLVDRRHWYQTLRHQQHQHRPEWRSRSRRHPGSTSWRVGALEAHLDLKRTDLGFAASRANALGLPELARYGGSLSGTLWAKRDSAEAALQTNGQLTARQTQRRRTAAAQSGGPHSSGTRLQLPAGAQPIRAGHVGLKAGCRDCGSTERRVRPDFVHDNSRDGQCHRRPRTPDAHRRHLVPDGRTAGNQGAVRHQLQRGR